MAYVLTGDELLWHSMMERYIPDEYTSMEIVHLQPNLYVMADSYVDGGYREMHVYDGGSMLELFENSGYLTGLCDQGDEYWDLFFEGRPDERALFDAYRHDEMKGDNE